MKAAFGPLMLVLLSGCNPRPDTGPVVVSVIGSEPRLTTGTPAAEPDRVLAGALAEGLVRFDASGQVEPGLAERWIVIDGGLRYIFRLRAAVWTDGSPVTTSQVVTILKRQLRNKDSSLLPFLTAIDAVVEMTPQVLEIRLARPRPDLLKLFAQPDLAIARRSPPGGGGPFRIVEGTRPLRLTPIVDPNRVGDDESDKLKPEQDIALIGEAASRGVARFQLRESDLVLGGTFADWPLVIAAGIAPTNIKVDPAAGLFGLAVARREGFLADSAGRMAVAAAIDRTAIVASLAPGAVAAESILPDRLDSAASAVQPTWATIAVADRTADALRRVAAFRVRTGKAPRLAIALPGGPGGAMLFRRLRFALAAIGIEAGRTGIGDHDADLRLIDRVAPYDSARWYLRTACAPCGEEAEAAIEAARIAPSADERARAIALADVALDADAAFIPLARPVRWSLVSLRLPQFQGNPRAWHPLDHLRNDPDK